MHIFCLPIFFFVFVAVGCSETVLSACVRIENPHTSHTNITSMRIKLAFIVLNCAYASYLMCRWCMHNRIRAHFHMRKCVSYTKVVFVNKYSPNECISFVNSSKFCRFMINNDTPHYKCKWGSNALLWCGMCVCVFIFSLLPHTWIFRSNQLKIIIETDFNSVS